MIINHNMNAMNAHRNMASNNVNAGKSMEKLSSGLRINRAGDDAAGLAISEKMRGQIRGLDQAGRNAQDGISLLQTGEGALNETHSILQRMRELAVQSSNDTLKDEDRDNIQDEVNQLAKEITRISDTTEFNGQKLMKNGDTFSGKFLIGANEGQTLDVSISAMGASDLNVNGGTPTAATADEVAFVEGTGDEFTTALTDVSNYHQADDLEIKIDVTTAATGTADITITKNGQTYTATGVTTAEGNGDAGSTFTLSSTISGLEDVFEAGESISIEIAADTADGDEANIKVSGEVAGTDGIDVSSQTAAEGAITTIDTAIATVSTERSKLGSLQNRLEHTISNLGTASENLTSAESRIRDVDMAKEMMTFSKNNILSQAAQAMMAQANQQPQGVLQLLR